MPDKQSAKPTNPSKYFPALFRKIRGMTGKHRQRLGKIAVFCIVLIIGSFCLSLILAKSAEDKIIPGVKIATVKVGGKTRSEAEKILKKEIATFEKSIIIKFDNQTKEINEFVSFNNSETVNRALSVGRQDGFWQNILTRLKTLISGESITPKWTINEEKFQDAINTAFLEVIKNPKDAKFIISFDAKNKPLISIASQELGIAFNSHQALNDLTARLTQLSGEPIELQTILVEPDINDEDIITLKALAEKALDLSGLQIKLGDQSWNITSEDIAKWLYIRKDADGLQLDLQRTSIESFLQKISKNVDRPPQNAIFEFDEINKRVTKFIPASPGQKVISEKNLTGIHDRIINSWTNQNNNLIFNLEIAEGPAKISTEQSNSLGIKEMVGLGKTNFSGSPPNRVKNIKRGAEILNNTLIEPDAEFSLLNQLRPFTEENGYFKELVIKAAEKKTVPEIGGGLCQIGTTMFRVVLNTGLPVTVRQNHFYRVSYYEPPVGMDATIYDPAPDFRFVNDTGHYLILRTFVKGNELIFEFWGSSDGRQVEISDPVISNVVSPPPKVIVETLDLKPGMTKCTEKAHFGADARFNYKVIYSDSRVEEKEFFSRYRPWQEVCLLGVEKLSEELSTETPPAESILPAD